METWAWVPALPAPSCVAGLVHPAGPRLSPAVIGPRGVCLLLGLTSSCSLHHRLCLPSLEGCLRAALGM